MSKWISVDPEDMELDLETDQGLELNVKLASPYDVPEAIKGAYDEKKGLFVIEFKYLSAESSKRREHNSFVTLLLGKHSGRLLGMEVDVDKLDATSVRLNFLTGVIDDFRESRAFPLRINNYLLAKAALAKTGQELF